MSTRYTMVACKGAGPGYANDHWIGRPHLWYEWSRKVWKQWRTFLMDEPDRNPHRCPRCLEKIR